MIVEERIYDIAVGLVPDYVRFYAEAGLPVSRRHGLELAAYFAVEGGNLHQVVHYWLHDSLAERQRQRRRVPRDADADWRHYQQGARARVTRQEVRLHVAHAGERPFAAGGTASALAVVEQLRWRVAPARVDEVAQDFAARGRPLREAAGARLLLLAGGLGGVENELLQLWYWRDHAEREAVLERSARDWAAFWRDVAPGVAAVERQFLRPIDPSPLR